MAGEFGRFIDMKRKGRGPGGTDILLKDFAAAMGVTATHLSDIVKDRRNPPEMETFRTQLCSLKTLSVTRPSWISSFTG